MWRLKPHQKRYSDFVNACPPVRGSKDPILAAHLGRTLQMDIAAQRELRERLEKLPLLVYAGWSSSSGLRMATELRRFWFEYFDRFARHGPTSLPSSFNVIEAFVRFDRDYLAFLPRPEREHLLRFSDYLDWYTASSFPEEPRSLIDIMEEGVSYSYDFALCHDEPTLRAGEAKLLCAGVTLIRHGDELAVLVLAGETPALNVTDFEFDESGPTTVPGKEKLKPSPDANDDSRLLEGWTSHSRVLLAARSTYPTGLTMSDTYCVTWAIATTSQLTISACSGTVLGCASPNLNTAKCWSTRSIPWGDMLIFSPLRLRRSFCRSTLSISIAAS